MTEEKGVGLKGWLAGPSSKKTKAQPPHSLNNHRIAVLPLSNISPDPKDEYFADGISDELISTIAKIQGLHVIARTSSIKYKGSGKGVSEIGQELQTGSIVEGTVRKAGNKVRITAQLIDAKSEESLWSETYDRELGDVFHIQGDIARQVAEALQVRLLEASKTRLERTSTRNTEAYTLYLKGQFHSNRTTEEDFKLSIKYYEQAIAIDPNFALAYAGIAGSYVGLGFQGLIASNEAARKARQYVEKSLTLDDTLAEAHRVLGVLLRVHTWDFNGALREFNRAIELNPSLADAHGSKAILLLGQRQFDQAIIEVRIGLELDPLSGRTAGTAGTVYLYLGNYEDAIKQFNRALKSDPNDALARGNRGLTYIRQGKFDIGIQEMRKVANKENTQTQSDLAYGLAKAGRTNELRKLLDELLHDVEKNHELSFAVATAYANLDDQEHALNWLERACAEHVSALATANANFVFDNVRQSARFQALMTKIGFTGSQQ